MGLAMRYSRRWLRSGAVLCLGAAVLILNGCGGDDPEEERFRQELVDKALNDDTRRAGDAFLAENANKPGVQVKPSGLQYKVLREGEGASPGPQDMVVVHYEGRTIDGDVFDSSYNRGKPARFPLNKVISGWTEGLMDMKAGGERMLYLPADLAYGARSPSPSIPANSALIFKVELLEVQTSATGE